MARKIWSQDKADKESKISNTEWGMVISLLAIIDVIQVGLDLAFQIGVIINRFIDVVVGLAWPTYLKLRGVSLNTTRVMSIILAFFFEEIPDVDALPLWTADGLVIYASVKAEKELEKAVGAGAAVAAVALAPESGGASLAAEGVLEGEAVEAEALAGTEGEGGETSAETENPETDELEEKGGSEAEDETVEAKEKDQNERAPEKADEGEPGQTGQKKEEEKNKGEERKRSRESSGKFGLGGEQAGRGKVSRADSNHLDLRGGAADKERMRKEKELAALQNVIDLTMSYGERKKQGEEK